MAQKRDDSGAASDGIAGLTERLWKNFRILSNAPMKFRPACKDITSMLGAWHLLQDSIQKYPIPKADNGNLSHFVNSCNCELEALEELIAQYKFYRGNFNVDEIMAIQMRLAKETDEVHSFYKILRSRTRESIVEALGKIPFSIGQSNSSTFDTHDMSILRRELPQHGISEDLVDQEFFFIEDWLQKNFPAGATFAREDKDVKALEEALPGYEAELAREATGKVQALEKTTSRVAIGSLEASSSADPPAYTFEDGGDELMDDEFSRDVQSAIEIENMIRAEHRMNYPELGVRPWCWLPIGYQKAYMDSNRGIIQMLNPDSFSVMAYETSLRCLDNIARLKPLLATTKGSTADAQRSLEVMAGALTKFAILQNQQNDEPFSDLDILDFEHSTAQAVDSVMQQFPVTEFELAQKSYYCLLTYIMGFLSAFSNIYTGRTAVIRSPREIEDLWKSKNMSAHAAWVEKQLTQWDAVEDSVSYCRNWYRTQRTLRPQALKALEDWQSAEKILSGVQDTDTIELTVISASEIPKSKLRSPSPWILLIIYGPNRVGGSMRVREWKTEPVQKSQSPVWNKSFSIDVPSKARWIDIEVFDRVAGLTTTLTKRPIRLPFSWIQGVEANFADKSLMYDYDARLPKVNSSRDCDFEERDIPIELDSKGKEIQPAILKIRLQWKGRISKVTALGLPTRGPGKMFRSDASPVPFPPEGTNVTSPTHNYPSNYGAPLTYDPYGQN